MASIFYVKLFIGYQTTMWGHISFIRVTGDEDLVRVDVYYYIIVTENTEMKSQYIEHTIHQTPKRQQQKCEQFVYQTNGS